MDFYQNAVETENAARVLFDAGMYRQSIYMYCLAIELYLKSRLPLVKYDDDLEVSHNLVALYRALKSKVQVF